MNKFLIPLFCAVLIFSFTSCGGDRITNITKVENSWCNYCKTESYKHCKDEYKNCKEGVCKHKHKHHRNYECDSTFCLPDSL